MVELRIGSANESSLQASKWLKSPALLEVEEMQQLFEAMGKFHLFFCSGLVAEGEEEISMGNFLDHYASYIDDLKAGKLIDLTAYRRLFSLILTKETDAVYVVPCNANKRLVRAAKPIIQMQSHDVSYSEVDGKFRSLVFGKDSISWGIQFSYPQLYRDEATKDIEQTRLAQELLNTGLFHILQRWMRAHTIPSTFEVRGISQSIPIRIGRQCLEWINRHAQLKAKGIHCKNA